MSEVKNGRYVDLDGTIEWYKDSKLHRDGGPAIEWSDGQKQWWINGKRHRDDGPAITYANRRKEWYQEGLLHREDGPAITYASVKKWFLYGIEYTEDEFNDYLSKKKLNECLKSDLEEKEQKPKVKI